MIFEKMKEEVMQIREIMSKDVDVINFNSPVSEAASLMRAGDYGALPVEKDDKMVGMITDRDITIRVVAENKDPRSTIVSDCMSEGIKYCYEDDDVTEVSDFMRSAQLRRIPVLNKQKRLVGMVSLGDLALHVDNKNLTAETLEGISRH
jgi:CBS domain-containing protein